MNITSDSEVIRRCQQGDSSGLEVLVARYQRPALDLARLLIGNRVLAEDIVQDSFLQAYRALGRFRQDGAFAPWFYHIVANTARKHYRASARRREVSLQTIFAPDTADEAPQRTPDVPDPAGTPLDQAERAEERASLLQAMLELTPKQREAVALRFYFGFRDQEIAAILGCSAGAANERLRSGLHALESVIRAKYTWLLIDHQSSFTPSLQEEPDHAANRL